MAFTTIPSSIIQVGKAIKKEIFDLLKGNLDDLDSRVSSLEVSGGSVFIFNGDIDLTGFSVSRPDIYYYKAATNFSVNDFRVQLFTKDGISSGNLVIDLEKSSDTNNANFSSILTSPISFNFASDAAYSEKTALINSSLNDIVTGDVLRVEITNVPSGFYGKILMSIGAQ